MKKYTAKMVLGVAACIIAIIVAHFLPEWVEGPAINVISLILGLGGGLGCMLVPLIVAAKSYLD